jgi:hypothetical protein
VATQEFFVKKLRFVKLGSETCQGVHIGHSFTKDVILLTWSSDFGESLPEVLLFSSSHAYGISVSNRLRALCIAVRDGARGGELGPFDH